MANPPVIYYLRCVNEWIKPDECVGLEFYVNGLEIAANGGPTTYLNAPLLAEVKGNTVVITDLHGKKFSLEPEEVNGISTVFALKNFIISCNCNCTSPPNQREFVNIIPDQYFFLGTELGVLGDTSAGVVNVELPPAADFPNIIYYANNIGSQIMQLDPNGLELINGAANYNIAANTGVSFASNGVSWFVFGDA